MPKRKVRINSAQNTTIKAHFREILSLHKRTSTSLDEAPLICGLITTMGALAKHTLTTILTVGSNF